MLLDTVPFCFSNIQHFSVQHCSAGINRLRIYPTDRLVNTTVLSRRAHVVGIIVSIHLILADTQQDLGFSPTTPDPLVVWE
jgi:hypothetical protein